MLRDVLSRRLEKRLHDMAPEDAAREREEAENAIEAEISRLVSAGIIDDARFAEMKARSGLSRGQGTRRILQDLVRKGVSSDVAEEAMKEARRETTGTLGRDTSDEDVAEAAEWEAAETFARKKRIGPYREADSPESFAERHKLWTREAGKMARAGFDFELIRQILDREPEE